MLIRQRRVIVSLLVACCLSTIAASTGTAEDGRPPEPFRRVLASASELDYSPFALVRDDGSADGFSVDLLKAVCHAVGLDITFEVGPWYVIKNALADGRLDVLPLVAHSVERDRVFDFTAPYFRMRSTIFVREGDTSIHSEADLKDKEVLVMRDDMAHEYAVRNNVTDTLILTDSFAAALQRLAGGAHDAVIVQHLVGLQLIKKLGITNLVSVRSFLDSSLKPVANPQHGFEQKICIAVREGDKELLAALNEGLALVITNGAYDRLYDQWFGPILPSPAVSPATIAKYLVYLLVPLLALIGMASAWLLRREVAHKTGIIEANQERLLRTTALLEKQSREREAILASVQDYVYILDPEGRFTFANKKLLDLWGLSAEQAVGKTMRDLSYPQNVERLLMEGLRRVCRTGEVVTNVTRYISPTGVDGFFENVLSPMRGSDGQVLSVAGSSRDITERKTAEAALRQLSQFPEENPNPVLRVTTGGTLMYMNAAAREMLFALNWQDGKPLPSALRLAVERVREQGKAVETEITLPDDRSFNFFAVQPLDEDYINYYGMNMTARKQAENALRDSEEHLKASLAEKEVLLKEIHHRVKNNMQVISSLVDLQAEEVADPAMRSIFQDVVNRVRSMAMVHEKLYQSEDLARVEFADYTRTLLSYLWRAQRGAESGIRYDVDVVPVFLPVNQAVPCGLVVNELFSNALKHAFKGRDRGRVTVSLQEAGDGPVQLTVRDDGIGLATGFDWQNAPSLGLRLVQMLIRQLKATLEISVDGGTAITVRFQRTKP